MLDALYKNMSTESNLKLAWNRICSAQNIQYKNYYRSLLVAYDLCLEENIKRLAERLRGGSYEPSDVLRFYMPKHSGLHRTITFLHLDDLIVYHALTNIIAAKFSKERKQVEYINAFSAILNRDTDKNIFFFKKWQEGYQHYIRKIKSFYKEGNTWVAHFDLAAYYDTISHDALSSQISRTSYNDFKTLLKKCLEVWSTHKSLKLGHGIPQGPSASNLIAEIYLLPIDKQLKKKGIKYLRYVDDIKILGASKDEVLFGIIMLENECKERGLIPQAKKYELVNAKTPDEAVGKNPSLNDDEKNTIFSHQKEVAQLLLSAFDPNNFDSTRIKYILKASEINDDILKVVMGKLNEHPELADDFYKFLLNYRDNVTIGQQIASMIATQPSPYKYVEGKYWELLSFYGLDTTTKKMMVKLAVDRLKIYKNEYCLKHGLYKFICSTNNKLILKWLFYEKSSLLQAFVIPHMFFNTDNDYLEILKTVGHRSHYEPILSAIKKIKDQVELESHDLKRILSNVKDASGVINNTLGAPKTIDSIDQIMQRRYKLAHSINWKKFLDKEYNHANNVLFWADKNFHIEKNAWANYMDSFNDILMRKFVELLNIKKPQISWPKLIRGDDKLSEYGNLLNAATLSKNYPSLIDGFRDLHNKRKNIIMSHAYDNITLRPTTYVTGREHRELCKKLQCSYDSFAFEVNKLI